MITANKNSIVTTLVTLICVLEIFSPAKALPVPRFTDPIVSGLTKYETRYIELNRVVQRGFSKDSQAKDIAKAYNALFGDVQNTKSAHMLTNRDLEAVFRAADTVAFYNPINKYVQQMQIDLDELQSRDILKGDQAVSFYGALFSTREFNKMNDFYKNYTKQHTGKTLPPPIQQSSPPSVSHEHEVLLINKSKRELKDSILDISRGVRVVVVGQPECHFTLNAIKDISLNPDLKMLMSRYSVWISPVDRFMDLNAFRQWNQKFPYAKISIAYSGKSWPNIKVWAVPTFIFFDNGKKVGSVIGWPRGGNAKALEEEFVSLGVSANVAR